MIPPRPPLAGLALAFVLGICLFQTLTALPNPDWGLAGAAGLVLVCLWSGWRGWPLWGLGMGLIWAWWTAVMTVGSLLPAALEHQELTVEGRVVGLPQTATRGSTRILFDIERASMAAGAGTAFSGLVRLSWWQGAPPLIPGESWRLKVRLDRPSGLANPGGFDTERYLIAQGIRAVGQVRDGERLAAPGWAGALDRLRWHLVRRLREALVASPRSAEMILALTLGEQQGIAASDWRILNRTGTTHLIAISGMHISLLGGLVLFFVEALWRLSATLSLRYPSHRAASVIALGMVVFYGLLAGWGLPIQRAVILWVVGVGVLISHRPASPFHALLVALALILAWDPWAVYSYGLWLSFAAVGWLMFSLAGRVGLDNILQQMLRTQWAVFLGLLPLLFYLFQQTSLSAPIINLVAVPWFSLVLTPLYLAGVVLAGFGGGFEAVIQWTAGLMDFSLDILAWAASFPWVMWPMPARPAWAFLLAEAGVFLLLLPQGTPGRWVGLALIAPLIALEVPSPPPGAWWMTLLDVGQGLSAVIRTHSHTLIFDAGPGWGETGSDAGSRVILPYLRQAGITAIDRLILSHADQDHIGGYPTLRDSGLSIHDTLSGEAAKIGSGVRPCQAGENWVWDGVRFSILHPPADYQSKKANNHSCLLRVDNAVASVLFPGDAEKTAESQVVRQWGSGLKSTLLVAGHHGSASSSSQGFLATVQPEIVLFASGRHNRFHFPKPVVVARSQVIGAKTWNTAVEGAIEFQCPDQGTLPEPHLFRRDHPRYWREIPTP